jgi:hypothetical protein
LQVALIASATTAFSLISSEPLEKPLRVFLSSQLFTMIAEHSLRDLFFNRLINPAM